MSNYPVDFKGTNMDESVDDLTLSMSEDVQSDITNILHEVLDTLFDVKRRQINVPDKDFKDAYISIEQTLQDLLGSEFALHGKVTGVYNLPVSQIQAQWLRGRKRILTSPATHAVMDEIAAQNKLASESEI